MFNLARGGTSSSIGLFDPKRRRTPMGRELQRRVGIHLPELGPFGAGGFLHASTFLDQSMEHASRKIPVRKHVNIMTPRASRKWIPGGALRYQTCVSYAHLGYLPPLRAFADPGFATATYATCFAQLQPWPFPCCRGKFRKSLVLLVSGRCGTSLNREVHDSLKIALVLVRFQSQLPAGIIKRHSTAARIAAHQRSDQKAPRPSLRGSNLVSVHGSGPAGWLTSHG